MTINYEGISSAGIKLPALMVNSDNEPVEISCLEDEDGKRYKVITYQSNGWNRTNYYWEDGTVEELYKKDSTRV